MIRLLGLLVLLLAGPASAQTFPGLMPGLTVLCNDTATTQLPLICTTLILEGTPSNLASSATRIMLEDTGGNGTGMATIWALRTETDAFAPNELAMLNLQTIRNGGTGNRSLMHIEADTASGLSSEFNVAYNGVAKATGGSVAQFGATIQCDAEAATTGVACVGIEADTIAKTGVERKVGLQVADLLTSTGAGLDYDAGIVIGKQSGGRGYNVGIQFAFGNTSSEINASYLFATSGQTTGWGVDFSGATFSGGSWKGNFTTESLGIATGLGDGGTVTQITSGTTAVTLNTISGTITLFSTARTAGTFTSFTVNDSKVLVTDTVILSQTSISGNNYIFIPVNVTNGSFGILIDPTTSETAAPKVTFQIIHSSTT